MIRKTLKEYKRLAKNWDGPNLLNDTHSERVIKETWWFLFIPIYSREIIVSSNL